MDKYTAAVDLGATNVRTALIDESGEIKYYTSNEVKNITDGSEIQMMIQNMIKDSSEKTGIKPSAIGISTAGPVDLKTGSVVSSPNMSCGRIFLTEPLSDFFKIPAMMATDCKAGAVGEYYFGLPSSKPKPSVLVYITFSSGIGSGIFADGKILFGSDGNAGEVGHIFVDSTYAMTCGCGKKGHWEAYSSGNNIPKFFSKWREEIFGKTNCNPQAKLTAGQILHAAELKSPLCSAFAETLAEINGRGLSSVIAAYNPGLIVLDGPVALNYPSLIAGKMIEHTDTYLTMPEIRLSSLNGKAPLLGASKLAFEEIN
ncbi:MAG: ROK family protein [Methanocorpusculum sp.]|nr:ROK family protein [Methanocorpusculum sp.]